MSHSAARSAPRRSFVDVEPTSPFPIQNLPFGVFRPAPGAPARPGVAIGSQVLDLSVLTEAGVLRGPELPSPAALSSASLNLIAAAGRPAWSALRTAICPPTPRFATPPDRAA